MNVSFWPKRIAYILLIVWVWGVSPLVYFKSISPHQGTVSFRVAILQKAPSTDRLPAILHEIAQTTRQSTPLAYHLQNQSSTSPLFEAKLHLPASYPALSSLLGESALTFKNHLADNNTLAPFSQPAPYILTGESAWQLPPDKPPTI